MNAPAVLPEVVSGRFVLDMNEEEYHAHPALSASGMKHLLRSPKHFRAARAANKAKPEFDFGHAVHALVLGVGAPIVQVPNHLLSVDGAERTKAAREWRAEAEAAGKTVLRGKDFLPAQCAAEAILANPKARALLEAPGYSEVSLFGDDPETGVHLRGRVDRLGDQVSDVKTTTDVRRHKLQAVVNDLNYDLSAATYRLLVELVLGYDPGPMHLIFVEKDVPFEVRVVPLGGAWEDGGRRKMRAAIDLFARCVEFGSWPGDDDDEGPVRELEPPAYYDAAVSRMEGAF